MRVQKCRKKPRRFIKYYIPSIYHILQGPVTWNSVIGLHEICQNYANKPDFKEVG